MQKRVFRERRGGGSNDGERRGGGSSDRFSRSDRSSGRPARRSFGGRPARRIKKMDPKLFVSAAVNHLEPDVDTQSVTTQFTDFALSETLQRNIATKGFSTPTPIQDQAIPTILSGRDVIGIAHTGTGKTGAFLIPLIEQLSQDPTRQALIVTPTRELAVQIREELQSLTQDLPITHVLVIGGANVNSQKDRLKRQHTVVIGTPGRLLDLIDTKHLRLNTFQYVVLDEVDRMVDIGFIKDVRAIVARLAKERQSLFFSATITSQVSEIISEFVHDPVRISLKSQPTTTQIEQKIVNISNPNRKIEILHDLLQEENLTKIIVFVRTKHRTDQVAKQLESRGFKAASIHGNKRQSQRQRALKDFKTGKVDILVATDVASRGIDVENVSHVINFDAPESYDDYVHRIGRTGRSGKTGVSITFVEN
jgi:ATP-dependent RNA helicase RhlE